MKVREVQDRAEEVLFAARSGDYEKAHALEDALYRDLLAAIANNTCPAPCTCAYFALRTQTENFSRHCA